MATHQLLHYPHGHVLTLSKLFNWTHLSIVHHRLVIHGHEVGDDRGRHARLPRGAAHRDVGSCKVWGQSARVCGAQSVSICVKGRPWHKSAAGWLDACRSQRAGPSIRGKHRAPESPARTCVCCFPEGRCMLRLGEAAAPAGQSVPAPRYSGSSRTNSTVSCCQHTSHPAAPTCLRPASRQ